MRFPKKISLVNDEIKLESYDTGVLNPPNLYDVCIRIYKNGKVIDEVGSLFRFTENIH